MSSPHQPPPGRTGSSTGSEGNSIHYPPTENEYGEVSYTPSNYTPSNYSQVSYGPVSYTPSNYSQDVPSSSSVASGYGQYGAADYQDLVVQPYDAADYQADVVQPHGSSNSSGRSSPGPGDSISVEWSEGETSEHSLDSGNRVMTLIKATGNWIYENDEKIVNFVSMVASPGVQGAAGLRGNAVANSVGLALAAGPGAYVVGKEVVNSLRAGRQGDLVRAAYGAVAAAGALTWGVGYAPGQDTTAGNSGAVVHGVGSGLMVTRGPREQPRRSHQDTESRGEIADTASSHRRSGTTSRDHTSRNHTSRGHTSRDHTSRDHTSRDHTSRDHTSRGHTSRTTGRDSGSSHEPASRRNGTDRTRDQHRRGGGGSSGGGGGVVR
ncbi:hypothetical protein [Micromonospora sp. WMMD714]|uniref:hypothetical protein n=1 Tax=Micromonospora sp. WMMD714 TaxID=3016097 RepID=UPI00249CA77D|nr:hypothetical protein [Micromonospora sp. WMMD714]WFE66142.1 hypothetical protein O7625_23890 [Micromonospora sp. WMMD714]